MTPPRRPRPGAAVGRDPAPKPRFLDVWWTGPVAGPLASWSFPVPNDPSVVGLVFFTQAVQFGGTTPFALSNAQDLYFGF